MAKSTNRTAPKPDAPIRMTGRLNWHAPRMGELSQNESAEMNARDHFTLRLEWADAVSRVLHLPLPKTLLEYTDVALRIPKLQNPGERWNAFLDAFEKAGDDRQAQLSVLLDFYRKGQGSQPENVDPYRGQYWPFRFNWLEDRALIYLHFGSPSFSQPHEEFGLLSDESRTELHDQLVRMFTDIKNGRKYVHARTVQTRTWVLSRDEFKRLLPPSFITLNENPHMQRGMTLERDGFLGADRWGQMYSTEGRVNQKRAQQFLRNLEHLDPGNLSGAFPYQTYRAVAPIEDFYRFCGLSCDPGLRQAR
ncbi:MAG TPA: hypothetical protein VEU95_16415 [Micropepsaceae bacterium]|nr:hypothetical protein [Micropepsaceae bacterium]